MFVICDQNDVIQDVATEEKNLSRGYTFPERKIYKNIKLDEVMIGDIFKDGVLTKNEQLRFDIMQKTNDEAKIAAQTRKVSIDQLIAEGQLPASYE